MKITKLMGYVSLTKLSVPLKPIILKSRILSQDLTKEEYS